MSDTPETVPILTTDERLGGIALPSPGADWALADFPNAYLDFGPPPDAETEYAQVGDRYFLPRAFWGRIHDPGLPRVHMELQYDGQRIKLVELRLTALEGQPGPASIDLGGAGGLDSVKRLPFRRIIKAIAAFSACAATTAPDGRLVRRDLDDSEHGAFLRALARHERAARASEGTDDRLRSVAEVYRRERDDPTLAGKRRAPVQAVMVRWGVSRATASRWIREARDRELLDHLAREGTER